MSVKDRIFEYLEYKGISVTKAESLLRWSKGALLKSNSISSDRLGEFYLQFPDISPEWLLTGRGNMLRPSVVQTNQNGDNINGQSVTVNKSETDELLEALNRCHEMLKKKDDQIDKLLNMLNK